MRHSLRAAIMVVCTAMAAVAQSHFSYVTQEGLQGTVRLKGSDSIDPLVRLWIQEFQKLQPGVQFSVESHGSGTAPAALLKEEAEIGHMSRPMSEKEIEAFQSRFGHPPTGLVVGFDALAVYVNHRNPIKQISIQQLDAIYGTTRLTGVERSIEGWWDLGLRNHRVWKYWVRPYGRDEKSGSRVFFQEKVLQKGGSFKDGVRVKDQMGIMEVVGRDLNAIGYGPESYRNPMVRMVPLSGFQSDTAYLPSSLNIQTGRYALARSLRFYVNREPGKTLAPQVQSFLEFVLSGPGQELSKNYGTTPLTPSMAATELSRIK